MNLQAGSIVYYKNDKYEILSAINFEEVLVKNLLTLESKVLKIAYLKSQEDSSEEDAWNDLETYSEKEIQTAQKRYEAIEPVLASFSRKEVERRAEEVQVSTATLYEWIRRYNSSKLLSSLIPGRGKGGKGKSRLTQEQDGLILAAIEEYYKTKKKPNITQAWGDLLMRCDAAHIKPPSLATFRRRIGEISEKERIFSREGKKKAKLYKAYPNKYDDAVRPLHIVEIDHTILDVYLVDDEYRLGLGRPTITIAIDEYSRMVVGYYLSFDAASFYSTGQAIIQMMLKKNTFLHEYGIESDWPVWGKANIIYTDNGKDFRGNGLKRACLEYGMILQHRPPYLSEFGGIVERIMLEINRRVHLLDGTTYSNISERGEYDSEGQAVLTLRECQEIIAIYILEDYHNQVHGSLNGRTPLEAYRDGIFGTDTIPPAGLPDIIEDERRLRITMLPLETRSVQRYGIRIENITYYDRVLSKWVNSYEEEGSHKHRKKFIVRRDPNNISLIFFYDPDSNKYFEIPAMEIKFSDGISLWEWRAISKQERAKNNRRHTTTEILNALKRARHVEEEAVLKSKKARKNVNRRKNLKLSVASKNTLDVKKDFSAVSSPLDPYADVEGYETIDDGDLSDFVEISGSDIDVPTDDTEDTGIF